MRTENFDEFLLSDDSITIPINLSKKFEEFPLLFIRRQLGHNVSMDEGLKSVFKLNILQATWKDFKFCKISFS